MEHRSSPPPSRGRRLLIRRCRQRAAERARTPHILGSRQRIGRRQLERRRHRRRRAQPVGEQQPAGTQLVEDRRQQLFAEDEAAFAASELALRREIGRASCRERVCPYVYLSVVAASLKNQQYISRQKYL